MSATLHARAFADDEVAGTLDLGAEVRRKEALLKTGALQHAIFNSANFSSIATDEKGVIQIRLISARNAMIGIQVARDSQPDVILMDINLPGLSGLEALAILREDPITAHIPIVALSANAMPRDIRKGMEAGFFRYVTKPINFTEFMNTLKVALEFAEHGAPPRT